MAKSGIDWGLRRGKFDFCVLLIIKTISVFDGFGGLRKFWRCLKFEGLRWI
jgi:hypothetical protein